MRLAFPRCGCTKSPAKSSVLCVRNFQDCAKHEMKKWLPLRQENAQLRTQVKAAQEQARLASSTALKKAIVMLEQLEQENLELRGHVRVLTRRLEQAGGYVDIAPPSAQTSH